MTSTDDNAGPESPRVRKTSTTNRFEIEKVEETELNNLNTKTEPQTSKGPGYSHPPALKKTVKHYMHDDDFFDLDSVQNTTDKKSFLQNYGKDSLDQDRVPLNRQKSEDDDEAATGCFQINYDERNEPTSITCNLNSNGVTSYRNCIHDFKTISLYQKLIAEFVGTCLLTLYACSIGLPISEKNVPSINGCLGGGLTLATLVWGLGNVSGGHLNPAVTMAFLFTGKINPVLTILYIASQLVGALTGAVILQAVAPTEAQGKLSVTEVHPDINVGQALGIEIIITFILVLTIFSCVDSRRNDLTGSFPLQIGLAVVIGGLFGGKFTGGSMNPARSFGPAIVTGFWHNHWVYWIGPIVGGVLAGVIYQFVLTLKCPRKPVYRPIARA